MEKYSFYITDEQLTSLASLPGSVSEHIRRAIDAYILKKSKELLKVSTSPSYDRSKKAKRARS